MKSTAASRARSLFSGRQLLPALALLALVVAGCGSSSSKTTSAASAPAAPAETTEKAATSTSSGTSASSSIALAADPGGQLKFDKSSLSASAGEVTVNFTNDSPIAHNVTIASEEGKTVGESPTFTGGSKAVKVSLKPGTYKFYCSVPGHRQAGMEGTLTVQ